MVRDFAYLIDTYGHVPNGTRTYYLSRSQPPFFFEMVGLPAPDDAGRFARYLPQLRREYAFWMDGAARTAAGHGAPARGRACPTARSSIATGTIAIRRAMNPIARTRSSRAAADAGGAGVSRHPRRGGERLGFQLALVRRRPQPRHHRYHRNRAGRSQQPAVRTRRAPSPPAASALRDRACAREFRQRPRRGARPSTAICGMRRRAPIWTTTGRSAHACRASPRPRSIRCSSPRHRRSRRRQWRARSRRSC